MRSLTKFFVPYLMAICLLASPSWGGRNKIEMTKNLAPEICGPIYPILISRADELAYDQKVEEEQPLRLRHSVPRPLLERPFNNIYPMEWGSEYQWNQFQREDPDKFD